MVATVKATTLKDVAALAGVSVKTVSNVVNGHSFVKPENRRRVEAALAATGYRPNLSARNLRRGRTGFLALVVPELAVPYFAELTALVITAAQRRDWNVLIEQTQGSREGERASLAALGPHLVDGAIVGPEALAPEDLAEVAPGVPLVLLGEHQLDPVAASVDRVAIDNVLAASRAVAHLIGLGRRRIAAIGQNPHRGTAAQRLAGYRAALTEAGFALDDRLIAPADNYHRRDGAMAMTALLDSPHPPDAVFCFNDLLAIGALRAAAERGVRVPEQLAIVGFDDTEESEYSLPSLTTIAPDKAAIAKAAIELVHRRVVAAGPIPAKQVHPPFTLKVRASTVAAQLDR